MVRVLPWQSTESGSETMLSRDWFPQWPSRVKLRYRPVGELVVLGIAWLLLPWPLVRAFDYATGTDSLAPSLVVFNAALSLQEWAIMFGTAGLIYAIGLGFRVHFLALAGHVACFAAYTAVAISLTQGAIVVQDGWRGIGPIFVMAVLHFGLAVLIQPWPKRTPIRQKIGRTP